MDYAATPGMAGGEKTPLREIENIIGRLKIEPSENLAHISHEDVRVAAAAVLIRRYASLTDYIIDMNLYFANAVNRRVQLICFPALTGMLPASALGLFSSFLPGLRPLSSTGMPSVPALHGALSFYSEHGFDIFFNVMSALSARYGVYTVAGSALCHDGGKLRHRAFLFSDTGDLVGFQDKISSSPLERELGVEPAGELKLFDTPLGALSILTSEDADYFEPARVAKNLGAKILVSPRVFTSPQTGARMALGLNMRVQENHVYGVQSVLVGNIGFGFSAQGAGCVFLPNEMLANKNGVASRTSGRHEPDVAAMRLNLEKLDQGGAYVRDKNPGLMEKYIDRLY